MREGWKAPTMCQGEEITGSDGLGRVAQSQRTVGTWGTVGSRGQALNCSYLSALGSTFIGQLAG